VRLPETPAHRKAREALEAARARVDLFRSQTEHLHAQHEPELARLREALVRARATVVQAQRELADAQRVLQSDLMTLGSRCELVQRVREADNVLRDVEQAEAVVEPFNEARRDDLAQDTPAR
jgi:hypothetical protein